MEVITVLVPIAIILALSFIGGFIWMSYKGQYDDLETPAMRMLLDEKSLTKLNHIDTNKGKK
jgi:cbb3-type cytochrome oxidase maturation protein